MLAGRHIVLGVTGSIASYKAAFLLRELVTHGAEVRVVMTPSACEFITPLTLAALSRHEVITEMFPARREEGTWHIDLGSWADLMLIAPASANTIAKCAHGFADNALTSLILALRCPLVVAPAMDEDMYIHPATQENLRILRERGVAVIEPETGELASGLTGVGRLPDPARIAEFVSSLLEGRKDYAGVKVLVTAGPTREPIDPVRFISNQSSGKMGFALARAAVERGGEVTLVTGPVDLSTPVGVRRIDVRTADDMAKHVMRLFPGHDLLFMAAAVADFTPHEPAKEKIKKKGSQDKLLSITLKRTIDILASVGKGKEHRVVVGFALETSDQLRNAREKLASKNADFIVLNSAVEEGAGFGSDTNNVTILSHDHPDEESGLRSKEEIAHLLLDRVREKVTRPPG